MHVLCVCMHVCLNVSVCVFVCVCACTCMCACSYVCVSSLAKILGECLTVHSPPVLFNMEISLHTLIPLFVPGVAECSPTSCMWARFLIGSRTVPGEQHSQPTFDFIGSRVYACLGITCHLHFWQNYPPFFSFFLMCNCGNMGVERTVNKSHHTKLTLEKKILLPLLLGFKLATFLPWAWHSYQQATPTPSLYWPVNVCCEIFV